jgi:hypothetical protein
MVAECSGLNMALAKKNANKSVFTRIQLRRPSTYLPSQFLLANDPGAFT